MKGKETRGLTSKASPFRETTIVDSVEHQLKDCSSSSEKGEWEIIRRKKSCPVQGNEDKEVLAELEGPPTKKVAMAKAVAAALNIGFEREQKGKEKKTDSLMEEVPQNPIK